MLAVILICIAVFARLIPHPANVTPFTSLSILNSRLFSLPLAIIYMLMSLFLSDVMLHYFYYYPLLGQWSLFTYSGYLLMTIFSHHVFFAKQSSTSALTSSTSASFTSLTQPIINMTKIPLFSLLQFTVIMNLFYWLWTNLGIWLFSHYYFHHWQGLMTCYIAALPFLRNSILGDLGWMTVLYFLLRYVPLFKSACIVYKK